MRTADNPEKPRRVGILVVSDTLADAAKRGIDADVSGKMIERELNKIGYETVRIVVPNDPRIIRRKLLGLLNDNQTVCVFTVGGTGISRKDVTVETVERMFSKRISGIGEELRRTGFRRIGFPALLSRTSAGLVKGRPVFCLPGAPSAVRVALRLILPNLSTIVQEAGK